MKKIKVPPDKKLEYGAVGITKIFPDSKCAADSNLILAKWETEYLPPLGIFAICSRIKLLRPPAVAEVASSASPIIDPIVFNNWNCGGRRSRLQIPHSRGPSRTGVWLPPQLLIEQRLSLRSPSCC